MDSKRACTPAPSVHRTRQVFKVQRVADRFMCRNCGQLYNHSSSLARHSKICFARPVMTLNLHCERCGKAFRKSSALQSHIKTASCGHFKCSYCKTSVNLQKTLDKHMEFHHNADVTLEEMCEKFFSVTVPYGREGEESEDDLPVRKQEVAVSP